MSDFGDFESPDAFDTEPADPEQVARKVHELRYEVGLESARWPNLNLAERTERIAIIFRVLAWMRRQGARP